jgi:hypothetical protein
LAEFKVWQQLGLSRRAGAGTSGRDWDCEEMEESWMFQVLPLAGSKYAGTSYHTIKKSSGNCRCRRQQRVFAQMDVNVYNQFSLARRDCLLILGPRSFRKEGGKRPSKRKRKKGHEGKYGQTWL